MELRYKIAKHNSTVCGYPGRGFDWSLFDWHTPQPHVDDYFIGENCQYLHVAYDYSKHGTVYRVRPNPSMRAGKIYRGYLILRQEAIRTDDGWYWVLHVQKAGEE